LPVFSTLRVKYDIVGSASGRDESPPQQPPSTTITDNPEAEALDQKYVWYIPEINDKKKKKKSTRKYVIPTCNGYLQRLTGIVDECERKFGQAWLFCFNCK
jgi:hypothetical protein